MWSLFSINIYHWLPACPKSVGGDPSTPLLPGGSNWLHLYEGYTFPCPANVTSWRYYRMTSGDPAYAAIWHRAIPTRFRLLHKTLLPDAGMGEQVVFLDDPIPVVAGDFLGLHYAGNESEPVVSSREQGEGSPPEGAAFTVVAHAYDPELTEGQEYDFSFVVDRLMTVAISAVLVSNNTSICTLFLWLL